MNHMLGVFGSKRDLFNARFARPIIYARILTFENGLGCQGSGFRFAGIEEYLVEFLPKFYLPCRISPHALQRFQLIQEFGK
jgi:hypothetical protein